MNYISRDAFLSFGADPTLVDQYLAAINAAMDEAHAIDKRFGRRTAENGSAYLRTQRLARARHLPIIRDALIKMFGFHH